LTCWYALGGKVLIVNGADRGATATLERVLVDKVAPAVWGWCFQVD
jgi:hypothetical protein